MKNLRISIFILTAALGSALMTACTKDDSQGSSELTGEQKKQVRNIDVQDAVSDQITQDADNTMDELQAQNYQVPGARSVSVSGSRTITVDHPDSTWFPKVITIVYNNYQEGNSTESFIKNGEVNVVVTAAANKQLITRNYTFKSLSVTTDSTTVTVRGTRKVERTAAAVKFNGFLSMRLTTTDKINSDLRFAIIRTGETDSLRFTREASKVRKAILWYQNLGGSSWNTIVLRNNLAKDTLTWTGMVTGTNEKGDSYSREIRSSDPLTMAAYEGSPVMISGLMDYTVTGSVNKSYTVKYEQDADHPRLTLVTVTDNQTQATWSFDRQLGHRHLRWW